MNIELPSPAPKQRQFMLAQAKHVAFGGARGGGKSFALKEKAILLCGKWDGIKVTIVRKTYPELIANHIRPLKEMLHIGQQGNPIRYNDRDKVITFPNGSMIIFKYNNVASDNDSWQGLETDVLMLDEATLFSREQLDAMRTCVRGANGFPKRIYYTCNPNGQSMGYIKRLFIDRVYEDGENPEDYVFIQSLLTDNIALMRENPDYLKQLESLPDKLKQAWLHGRWDVFEGMYFSEFRTTPDPQRCHDAGISVEDALEEHRWTHVVEPFEPPKEWKVYRSYDWGYGKPYAVTYHFLTPDDVDYQMLEIYGCTATPNEGVHMTNKEQADAIQRFEAEHPWLKGRKIGGVADPSIWDGSHDTYGVSCAEEMDKHGIYFEKGNNERVAGWMQFRERMKFDENGRSMYYVTRNCRHTIRTIPLMMFDERKPEDLDTSLEDHLEDTIRYFCMMRPIPPRIIGKKVVAISDPLNQFGEVTGGQFEKYNKIKIYRE